MCPERRLTSLHLSGFQAYTDFRVSRISAGSILSVSGWMSTNIGNVLSYSKQFAEATKLKDVVRTSSSGPMPSALTQRCRAEVPLLVATAKRVPTYFANSSSNSETRGPRLRFPDRRTRVTESISRSPISGCESGMLTQHPLSQKEWREVSELK